MATVEYDPDHLEEDEFLFEVQIRGLNVDDPLIGQVLHTRILTEGDREIPWTNTMRVIRSVHTEVSTCKTKLSKIYAEMEEAAHEGDQGRLLALSSRLQHVIGRIGRLEAAKGEVPEVKSLLSELGQAEKAFRLGCHSQGAAGFEFTDGSIAPVGTPASVPPSMERGVVPKRTSLPRPQSLSLPKQSGRTVRVSNSGLGKQQEQFLSSLFRKSRNLHPYENLDQIDIMDDPAVAAAVGATGVVRSATTFVRNQAGNDGIRVHGASLRQGVPTPIRT